MAEDINNTNEPKIHEEVLSEIKKMGEGYESVKKNYEEQRKEHEAFKKELEAGKIDKTKVEKIQEAMITRQEELDKIKAGLDAEKEAKEKEDKETKERIDGLEIAFKRPHTNVDEEDEEKVQKEMKRHYLSCRGTKEEKTTREQWEKNNYSKEEYETYKKNFETYIYKGREFLTPAELKVLSVGSDSHGGYTVLPALSNEIITKLWETDPIRQLASVESITTDSIEFPVDWDEADAGWVNETQDRPQTSTPNIDKLKIFVHEMYAAPRATQQILEDSTMNIEQWLAGKVAKRFGRLEEAAFVNGDGIGKPQGVLQYANGTTFGTIQQTTTAGVGVVGADDFITMLYTLQEYYINRGTWIMNRTSVRDIMRLKDGVGNYLWKPPWAENNLSATILGLPVRMSATMPTIATGALSIALADWKEAYKIVDRLGISVLRDPYTVAPYIRFYTRRRVGGAVSNFDAIKIMDIQ